MDWHHFFRTRFALVVTGGFAFPTSPWATRPLRPGVRLREPFEERASSKLHGCLYPRTAANSSLDWKSWTHQKSVMTQKEFVLDAISELPDDATLDQIADRVDFLAALQKGFDQLDRGEGIPHQELKRQLASWLTS
jgi:hypothetical protein